QPSLEAVFAQLAEVEDGDALAGKILDVMKTESEVQVPGAGMRAYRAIAGALPQEFQNIHGEELLRTSEDARPAGALETARMLADVAIRVPIEYVAEFRKDFAYAAR